MEKQARIVLAMTAVVLSVMLGVACFFRAPKPAAVQTAVASAQDIYNSITVQGIVEAADSVAVCPYENAVITAVYAAVGYSVEAGDILCSLVPREGKELEASSLQSVWKSFSESSDQTVAAEERDAIRAPVSGTVLTLPMENEQVWSEVPCVQIADLNNMQVRVRTPEVYAGNLQRGQMANITASAAGERVYSASVASISPVAVRTVSLTGESGEATVEAVLPLRGSTEGLRPGYSVTAKIFTDYHPQAVAVPYEAVCQRGKQEYVFCVQDGRAVQKAVTTGYLLEEVTEITEGLTAGELVILSPSDNLTDGTPVEVAA